MNIRFVIILFSYCIMIPNAFGQNYEQLKSSALAHIQKNENLQAIEVLLDAKKVAPNEREKVKIDNSVGWLFYLEGNNSQAEIYLLKAFEGMDGLDDPSLESKIINNLGIFYFTKGDLEEAKKYFQMHSTEGNEIASKYLSIIKTQEKQNIINKHIRDGILFRQNREFDKAVKEYDEALKLTPNNISALEYKGYALLRLRKFDESLEATTRALELDPENINAIINLIKVYCAKKDMEKAEQIKNEAKLKHPEKYHVIENDGELQLICNPPRDLKIITQ